ERAREADPLASFPYTLTGWGLLVSGRPEEGLRHVEDALTFEKEDVSAISASCMGNVALRRLEEGIAAGEHGVAVSRRAPFFLGVLGWALATAGRKDEARKILEELGERLNGIQEVDGSIPFSSTSFKTLPDLAAVFAVPCGDWIEPATSWGVGGAPAPPAKRSATVSRSHRERDGSIPFSSTSFKTLPDLAAVSAAPCGDWIEPATSWGVGGRQRPPLDGARRCPARTASGTVRSASAPP